MEPVIANNQDEAPIEKNMDPPTEWQPTSLSNGNNHTAGHQCGNSTNEVLHTVDSIPQKKDWSIINQCKTEPSLSEVKSAEEIIDDPIRTCQRPVLQQITAVVHPLPAKPIHTVCAKNRTRFSPSMVQFMEKNYQDNKYPKAEEYKFMASLLGLDWNKIKIWFQNRRSKERKENGKVLQDKEPDRKRRKLNPSTSQIPIEQKPMDFFDVAKLPHKGMVQNSLFSNPDPKTNTLAKLRDDVGQLTSQLCTSQITKQNLALDSQPGMWQPFCGIRGNEPPDMKNVKPNHIPSGGVLIPPVVQPMLFGMPPVYMFPSVTPIDLTKKPDINPYYQPRQLIPGYRVGQYDAQSTSQSKMKNSYSFQQNQCAFAQPIQPQKTDIACNNDLIRYTQAGWNKPVEIYTEPKVKPSEYRQFQGPTPLQRLLMNDSFTKGISKTQAKSSECEFRKVDVKPPSKLTQFPIPSSVYAMPCPAQYDQKYPQAQSTPYNVPYNLYSTNSSKPTGSLCSVAATHTLEPSATITEFKKTDAPVKTEFLVTMDPYKARNNDTSAYRSSGVINSDATSNLFSTFDNQSKRNTSLNTDPIYLQVTPNTTCENQVDFTSESVELQMESKSLSLMQNSVPVSSTLMEPKLQPNCHSSSQRYFEYGGGIELRDSGIGASVNHHSDNFSFHRAGTSQTSTSIIKSDVKPFSPNTYSFNTSNVVSQLSPVMAQNSLSPTSSPPLCTSTPVKGGNLELKTDETTSKNKEEGECSPNMPKSPICFDQLRALHAGEYMPPSQPYEFPIESSLVSSEQYDLNNNSASKDFSISKDYVQL